MSRSDHIAMRIAVVAILLGLSFGAWAEGLSAGHFRPEDALFKVRAVDAAGGVRLGSAVLVAPGRLVTNAHVSSNAERIEVASPERTWAVAAQSCNRLRDLCVLKVPGLAGRAADLRSAGELTPGEPVFAVGYPDGGPLTRSRGEVKALHAYDAAWVIQTSAEFDAGASGGALFDGKGRLVGVITFKSRRGGDFHFALPAEWVAAALAAADGAAPLGAQGAFWEESGERLPPFLRAAALEARGRWQELLDLAAGWMRAETDNAAPWLAAAKAYQGLGRPEAAAAARARAQSLTQLRP